ncbi:MAG: RDD family protein [Helicobacteraceae bacterium]|jgi:uncharacterized RDD family membrane protein YckC|nr:RDD family protein [Helicobacteraceae bacterium]
MDSGFISITQRLVSEQGKNALLDPKQCKAHLSDYAKGEFKKERHLLMVAIEAGAAKEIVNASDLATCKKIQARFLKDERFIDETAACEIVDLLAFVLRGDNSQSIATPPNSQYASPSTSQSQYASQQSAYPQYAPPQQQSYQQNGYQYPPNTSYPPQSQQIKYIGFWARLTADIIDNVLLFAIFFALFFIMGAMGFFNSMSDSDFDAPPFQAFANIVGMVVAFIYAIAFWATKQATPGKMIFGAKIVDAKTLGKPSGGQLVGRYFAYIISAIPLCLGFLWVAFDSQKRGWHDMLAGTLVIKA